VEGIDRMEIKVTPLKIPFHAIDPL
jgi:hypothetical protein